MLSLSAIATPASGPGAGIRSTRSPSASSASSDQCSTALSPSAARSFDAVSSATARPLTGPPWRRGAGPGRSRRRTPEPSPPAAARGAPARGCRHGGAPGPDRGGTAPPDDRPVPRRAGRRSPRSGSSAAPGAPPRPRARPARPGGPRAAPRRVRCSCALPFSLEARVGHQQLLHPDLLVVELDRDLEIPAGAARALDRAAPEAPVPDALAFDEAGGVLRDVRVGGRRVAGSQRRGGVEAGLLLTPPCAPAPLRPCAPVRRPQRRRPLLLYDAGR